MSAKMNGYPNAIDTENMMVWLAKAGFHLGDPNYIFQSLKRIREGEKNGDQILNAFCYGLVTGICAGNEE